jgi:hypothetical protein
MTNTTALVLSEVEVQELMMIVQDGDAQAALALLRELKKKIEAAERRHCGKPLEDMRTHE